MEQYLSEYKGKDRTAKKMRHKIFEEVKIGKVKGIEGKGCSITIRPLRITDLCSVHRLCDSLSQESKYFFRTRIFGFKSISWDWLVAQGMLILSSITFMRCLLRRVYARASFITIVAVKASSHNNQLIGFAYLHGGESPRVFSLGICVHDFYQGLGVGSKLIDQLIRWAQREDALAIHLFVHRDNVKAMSLFKKHDFKLLSYMLEWKENKREES